jgi:hypothetical protein
MSANFAISITITSFIPARCSEFFYLDIKKSHDNMYVILIWKRSITDVISDIISHDFFQPLILFLLYGK